MWLVFLLVVLFTLFGVIEFHKHKRNLSRISVRIHINGTRGKSSVTRLVGGGLKGGGKRVFVKTTGTSPRTIDPTGYEEPIRRVGSANIIEQLGIVAKAADNEADFFVVECMALIPNLQYITEHQMIKSQVGIITNIREDHLDVMGPTVDDVAEAICNTIPEDGLLFTTEERYLDVIKRRAAKVNCKVVEVTTESVNPEDLSRFGHLEHKDNVAVALAVCEHFGVDKESALQGMIEIKPDPGALKKYTLKIHGHTLEFLNAFAANDPDSYRAIWDMLHLHRGNDKKLMVLVNSRRDRVQRAEQLGEFIARELEADYFIISGEATKPLVHKAQKNGLASSMMMDLGGKNVIEVFDFIDTIVTSDTIIVGIGNIVGLGDEIVRYFINKGRMVA